MMERMDVSREDRGEPLRFDGRGAGEIATLVDRYNRMAEKARASALALAQSERESAWREMAMQVAHEIKNPLTPMKLGVQQLSAGPWTPTKIRRRCAIGWCPYRGRCKARLTCWCALRMNSARWPDCLKAQHGGAAFATVDGIGGGAA